MASSSWLRRLQAEFSAGVPFGISGFLLKFSTRCPTNCQQGKSRACAKDRKRSRKALKGTVAAETNRFRRWSSRPRNHVDRLKIGSIATGWTTARRPSSLALHCGHALQSETEAATGSVSSLTCSTMLTLNGEHQEEMVPTTTTFTTPRRP